MELQCIGLFGESVDSAELRRTKVTDASLACLKALPNLHYLALTGTQVTDAGLENVKELTGHDELALHRPGGPVANATASPASSGNGTSTVSSQAASATAANGEPNGIAGRIHAQGGLGDGRTAPAKAP